MCFLKNILLIALNSVHADCMKVVEQRQRLHAVCIGLLIGVNGFM